MQKIKYADMHCDTVSVACNAGVGLKEFGGQINLKKLKKAGCAVQCFALFTEGAEAAGDFERYCAYYKEQLAKCKTLLPATSSADIKMALSEGKTAAVLTVENLGFLKGEVSGIDRLYALGVRMASLVWNNKNDFACPNLITDGYGRPYFTARQEEGLTEAGREAVARMDGLGIIQDVSHLSDGGLRDVLSIVSRPIVASHSDCDGVNPFFRNLTDGQIKSIAERGGIAGLNLCRDFLGGESATEAAYNHFIRMVNSGGEDFPALGTDFDGILAYDELADCTYLKKLFRYFRSRGVKPRLLEKFALGNFLRVFTEVAG